MAIHTTITKDTMYHVLVKPTNSTMCIPELCPKICAIANAILYKAMYSPWLPCFARFKAKALENGKQSFRQWS